MSYQTTNTTNEPVNTNLRILKLDKKQLIDDITKFHKELNNIPYKEINVDELKKKYSYIADNFNVLFNGLIENPTAPLDMVINMVITTFAIGNKEIDGKKASVGIAYELHRRYTDKS